MEDLSKYPDLAGISAITEQNTTNLPRDTLPDGTSQETMGHGLQSRTSNACDWDTYQDRCEMALFLRCFSESPGKWTDVLGSHQLYFSQNIITLSQTSPVIRYAACALGAKYLGRVKGPALKTHTTMRNGFTESQPDFLWYGTKYYDKALQLLAQQAQAPCDTHGITMTSNSDNPYDRAANIYPAIAECILSQYVDISETITTAAISIHLDNVDKLLRFSDYDPASPWTLKHVPEPDKAISSIFWCFAINDALDSYVSRRRTRLDPNNLPLWRELGGLPLNDKGDLLLDHISEQQKATLLFKSLVRLLCQLLNSSLSDTAEWITIKSEFDRWYSILPNWFSSPLVWTWAPDECPDQDNTRRPAASSATWFSCDTCALAMAFYHMGRMLLFIHQPIELFLEQYGDQPDVLYTYKKWWKDLRQHSSQTVSIARGMPNDTVRKYLLQPLHVAGRCMLDTRDRLELLDIFKQIGDDLGFTATKTDWFEAIPIVFHSVKKATLRYAFSAAEAITNVKGIPTVIMART
ncbi:hypothetical protein AbraIFM66951_011292 [Aspergillus brasiliensis]|uniref:Transcription factor domain-containing protein n=1 Tax=Aspergillus brasiliensis TaxID=319629 RepID=A0A9W5YLD6_9EURO|nr:hypothetical protein AbraCBS73388_004384 [Aspergillus brasiliensis]GKZ47728.1 hypothetical protein AbraIFM66951_011292 [Aspergillus brasiliensis]